MQTLQFLNTFNMTQENFIHDDLQGLNSPKVQRIGLNELPAPEALCKTGQTLDELPRIKIGPSLIDKHPFDSLIIINPFYL